MNTRGGSRISRGGAWTHFGGGAWTSDTHTHFLVKMYVKTKELGPVVGGGRAPENFVCRSAMWGRKWLGDQKRIT